MSRKLKKTDNNKKLAIYLIASLVLGLITSLAIIRTIQDSIGYSVVIVLVSLMIGFVIGFHVATHDNPNKHSEIKKYIIILISAIIGISIGMVIDTAIKERESEEGLDSSIKEEALAQKLKEEEEEASEISTYSLDHTVLDDKDAKDIASKLLGKIEKIASTPHYFEVITGGSADSDDREFTSVILNSNNEIVEQTSDGSVLTFYRNDGVSIRYGSTFLRGQDISTIEMIKNVLNTITDGVDGAHVYEMHLASEDSEGYEIPATRKEYRIDLTTEEAVRAVYKTLGKDFEDKMLDNIKAQVGDTWEPHLVYTFIYDDSLDQFGAYATIINNNTETTAWIITQFEELAADWQLPEDWYNDEKVDSYTEDEKTALVEETFNNCAEAINETFKTISGNHAAEMTQEETDKLLEEALEQNKQDAQNNDSSNNDLVVQTLTTQDDIDKFTESLGE